MTLTRRAWFVACGSAAIPPSFAESAAPMSNETPRHQGGRVRRQLRFNLTLLNPHSRELHSQKVRMQLPIRRSSVQRSLRVTVSAEHTLIEDELEHQAVEFRFDRFAPLASKAVSIVADLEMRVQPEPEDRPSMQGWLAEERYIEVEAAAVRRLAMQLRGPTDWETSRAIYEWVRGNLVYAGYMPEEHGALRALEGLRGDCTEYAYLAVALARASGIPARAVGGYVVDRNSAPRPEEYHDWAELYVDGAWRLVDAQKRRWLAPAEDYVGFKYYRQLEGGAASLTRRYHVDGELLLRM